MNERGAAIVTGSTSGIGLGIARALAGAGWNVMLNGFGEADAIEAERAGIETDFGVRAAYHGADMSKGTPIRDGPRRACRAADTWGTGTKDLHNARGRGAGSQPTQGSRSADLDPA